MINTPHSSEDFVLAMGKGFPWDRRCQIVADFIRWYMMEISEGATLRNGELTVRILKALGLDHHRSSVLFKALSNAITHLGKQEDFSDWIVPGKQIKCRPYKDGTPRYSTERMWRYSNWEAYHGRAPKEATDAPVPVVQTVDNVTISRQPQPGFAQVTCGQCGGCGKVYMRRNEDDG